jgi:hypothetical protein
VTASAGYSKPNTGAEHELVACGIGWDGPPKLGHRTASNVPGRNPSAERVLLLYAALVFAQVQKLHDQYIADVDKLKKVKDAELREHRD